MTIRNAALSREDNAKLLSKHVVITVPNETAMCPSLTDPSKMYHVNIKEGSCDCPDNQYRGVNCMHMQAVDFHVLEKKIQANNIKKIDTVCNELKIEKVKFSALQENPVLKKIFDEVGIENTQDLIRKDLLLEPGTVQALKNWSKKN